MAIDPSRLDEVIHHYRQHKDLLLVAKKLVDQETGLEIDDLFEGTFLFGSAPTETRRDLNTLETFLDDYFEFSMWSVFERCIYDYIQTKGACLGSVLPEGLAPRLRSHFQGEVSYWKLDRLLGLFTDMVPADVISKAREIKKFRDWIAHGKNPRRLPERQSDPETTYFILSQFIESVALSESRP